MNMNYRRTLAILGATAAAVASTAFLATPAQAATSGLARVVGSKTVEFRALMGRVNAVKVTISGRTVTIDDRVAITAGKGCKRVDATKVRCTTSAKTATISVALGDKNDTARNYTSVFMLAGGGAGNDTLTGGSGADELQGGAGADKLYGGGGKDVLFGESGADYLSGGAGNDILEAGSGNDRVLGGAGNDTVRGYSGNDKIWGGVGNDFLMGNAGNDTIAGEQGDDVLVGEHYKEVKGKGVSSGSATAVDKLYAGANTKVGDICLESSSKTTTSGCEYYTAVPAAVGSSAARVAPLTIG